EGIVFENILISQGEALDEFKRVIVFEVRQSIKEVFAPRPADEDILAVPGGIDVAAEFYVVLAKNVVEVVLRLELGVVVIGRQEELLSEDSGTHDEHRRHIAVRVAR